MSEIKKQIAIGFWSRETRVAVMSQEFSTLNDTLQRILDMESLEVARKQRIAGKREQSFRAVWREVSTGSSLLQQPPSSSSSESLNNLSRDIKSDELLNFSLAQLYSKFSVLYALPSHIETLRHENLFGRPPRNLVGSRVRTCGSGRRSLSYVRRKLRFRNWRRRG